MKSRKKPVIIEAIKWTGENLKEVNQFLNDGLDDDLLCNSPIIIETLEGDVTAQVGYWIIKGVQGEFYPIRNAIFMKTYERVD